MAEVVKLMATVAIILVVLHGRMNPSFALEVDHYIKCPKGFMSNNTGQSDALARSPLHCFQRCSQTQRCSGVNVCTNGSLPVVSCGLLYDVPSTHCDDLTSVLPRSCVYAHKVLQGMEATTGVEETTQTTTEMTTTQIVCQNGGTPNGERCDCTIQYGGRTCHRFIRDCTEAYNHGYQSSADDGAYMIQPASSPATFYVLCSFTLGGRTLPLRRLRASNFDKIWNTCKVGFGDNLSVTPNSRNFFIGLEHLYRITKQASYQLEMYMEFSNDAQTGRAIYHNFTIGPESESYALTYDQFDTAASTIDNGFSTSRPVRFAARGKYHNNCYTWDGAAGWYGMDCGHYSVFFDGSFYWTRNGPSSTKYWVDMLEFRLLRTSAFYEG